MSAELDYEIIWAIRKFENYGNKKKRYNRRIMKRGAGVLVRRNDGGQRGKEYRKKGN